MARMFNCDESMLINSMHDETMYRIIKHNNHVRIPGKSPIDLKHFVKDHPDNEWEILAKDGVNVYENQTSIDEARTRPGKRVDFPNDVFLFHSSQYDNPASNPFGVLAMAGTSITYKYLTRSVEKRISIEPDVKTGKVEQYSWHSILEKFHKGKTPPSNALVVIDRFIFNYLPEGRVDYKNGVRNLFGILNELLPQSFDGEYQILLVFDPTKISRPNTMDDVVKALQTIKKVIRGGRYIPTIELLPISADDDREIYSETHDRRIISNYFSIEASHGFSAILPPTQQADKLTYTGYGFGTWGQKIEFKSIYAGIEKEEDDLDLNSLPISFNEEILRYLRKYVVRKTGRDGVEYICNGNRHCDISELRNRLVRAIKQEQ